MWRGDVNADRPLPPITWDRGRGHGGVHLPSAVAVDGDILYLSASDNHTILRYDLALEEILSPFMEHSIPGLESPEGLAIQDGVLYIASNWQHMILRSQLHDLTVPAVRLVPRTKRELREYLRSVVKRRDSLKLPRGFVSRAAVLGGLEEDTQFSNHDDWDAGFRIVVRWDKRNVFLEDIHIEHFDLDWG